MFFTGVRGVPPAGVWGPGWQIPGTPAAGGGPGGLLQRFCLRSLFLGAFRHFVGWDPPGTPLGPPLGPPWDPPGSPLRPPGPPGTWNPPRFVTSNRRAFLDPPPTPLGPPSDPLTPPPKNSLGFGQKSRTRETTQSRRFQYLPIAFLTGTRADPGSPSFGVFLEANFPFQGGVGV